VIGDQEEATGQFPPRAVLELEGDSAEGTHQAEDQTDRAPGEGFGRGEVAAGGEEPGQGQEDIVAGEYDDYRDYHEDIEHRDHL
jgi:hypothetical protein